MVFVKISEQRLDSVAEQLGIQAILQDIAHDEARMVDMDQRLKKELEE